jgi:hypothetical protein
MWRRPFTSNVISIISGVRVGGEPVCATAAHDIPLAVARPPAAADAPIKRRRLTSNSLIAALLKQARVWMLANALYCDGLPASGGR